MKWRRVDGLERATKPITNHSVIWKSLIFNGGGRSSSTNQLHSLHSKKNNFSFRFVHFVNCFDEMDEVKRYYNSNLYEADSYLVIIIECFCEEWTNTWNWLRGELVASYKASAHQSHQNQFNSSLPNGKNWLIWLIAGWLAPREWMSEKKKK